jgi:SNF2 family DNA or RNA helicase
MNIILPEISSPTYSNKKMKILMEEIRKVIEKKEKIVIFSQWVRMLEVVEVHLRQQAISFLSITGDVSTQNRTSVVEKMNGEGCAP